MTFPASLDSFGTLLDNVDDAEVANINELRRAIEYLEAKVGIDSSAVITSLDYKVNNFFASGRKPWIYENTAPTGWSILSVTDRVLAVKGGSNDYNVDGGNQAGTWTQPDHTLTVDEIPAHTHTAPCYDDDSGASGWIKAGFNHPVGTMTTSSVGGGNSHYHGTTYRPYAAVGIIIEKD